MALEFLSPSPGRQSNEDLTSSRLRRHCSLLPGLGERNAYAICRMRKLSQKINIYIINPFLSRPSYAGGDEAAQQMVMR